MVTGFLWRRRWDSNPRGAHHAKTISSRSRYDHFDTSPYMSARHFSQPFSDEKGLWKELTERTANLFNFRTVENPHGYRVFGGRNGQLPARFRVRPVMTTSITLRIRFIELNKELIYFTKRTYLCQMIYSNILIYCNQ